MFDYLSLQHNAENPTLVTILLTVLFAFVLSSLIVFTYDKTSRDVARSLNYMQSLVLISIVAATVMQAIGDSLARGLGMLGALAIIRFRTTLRNPRNMTFMFASLAAGIACGVYGFVIAVVGTMGFCTVAFVLYWTPFSQSNNLIGRLRYEVPAAAPKGESIRKSLKKYCRRFALKKVQIIDSPLEEKNARYEYQLKMRQDTDGDKLIQELYQTADLKAVRLSFEDKADEI
ncbi:MAG: DUF4956 domain-containing protein [Bacteroidota bacterium]